MFGEFAASAKQCAVLHPVSCATLEHFTSSTLCVQSCPCIGCSCLVNLLTSTTRCVESCACICVTLGGYISHAGCVQAVIILIIIFVVCMST